MKRIVFFILCFLAALESAQASIELEKAEQVFFHSIPDRKTSEGVLEPLLTEEPGESRVLSEKLSGVLTKLFSIQRDNFQEECECLAQALYSAIGYDQQLGTLDSAGFRW
ncbi:MAG: hypothetical protein K2W94_05565 [Alphaproteobacteria bacterium]|nr:hypothetical protein [Alphaproteobacteria bacterium]